MARTPDVVVVEDEMSALLPTFPRSQRISDGFALDISPFNPYLRVC
jgi:hypothetical protein